MGGMGPRPGPAGPEKPARTFAEKLLWSITSNVLTAHAAEVQMLATLN
jgi:hypothetical protein